VSVKTINGEPEGRMVQVIVKGDDEINLDLFVRRRQTNIASCHTHRQLGGAWVKLGWVCTDDDLHKKFNCEGTKDAHGKCIGRLYSKMAPAHQPGKVKKSFLHGLNKMGRTASTVNWQNKI